MTNIKKDKPKIFKTNFYNPYDTKKRTRTTKEQLGALESIFQCSPKPPLAVRRELSAKLEMPMRNVQVWFQNRRAKAKSTNSFPVPPEDVALNEAGSFEAARMIKNIKSLTVTIPPSGLENNNISVSHLVNHSASYINPNLNIHSPFGNGMNMAMFSYPQTPWSAQLTNFDQNLAHNHRELASYLRTSPTTEFPHQSQLVSGNFLDFDSRRTNLNTSLPSSLTPFSAGLLTSPFPLNLENNFLYTPTTESFPFDNEPFYQNHPVPSYSHIN